MPTTRTTSAGDAAGQSIWTRLRSALTPAPETGLADPYAGTWAARDTSVAWMTFMGIPQEGTGVDSFDKLRDFANAPADVAWVYACVNRLATASSSVPLRVYVKKGKALERWEDAPTPAAEDLQALLDTANPVDMTGQELRYYTAASRKVWGGWYWKRVRGRLLHDTQELYWLRVPDVWPHSADGRAVDYYEYRPTLGAADNAFITSMAGTEIIDPADMIRHRGLNLRNQVGMMSPLSAARFDMVTDSSAAMQTASILRRRGVPEGYWKAAPGAQLTPQDRSSIRRWLRQLVGPRNAGRSLVAPDIEYVPLQLPEKDAEWLLARKVSRMMVSAILGVPLVLAGDDEHAGVYRSVRDAQAVMWRDTVIPENDADADTLNNWLVPEFNRPGDPRLCVGYDYSGVEAIKPLWNEEWQGWISAVEHQIVVPNHFIDHFGLGEHVPWGDKPVPKTMVTFRPNDTGNLAQSLPFLEEAPASATAPASASAPVVTTPENDTTPPANDAAETVRAFGKGLYKHPAVRAFLAGQPLDPAAILGGSATPADQVILEAGLRARLSAGQIADRLATRKADVTEAVLAGLRKQWPEKELEVVRQGSWEFEPKFPVKDLDAKRRPNGRNPKIVAGVEAMLAVGADTAPITVVDGRPIGEKDAIPLDGWHRTLAYEHEGRDTIPAFVGTGDADWTNHLIDFMKTLPTPSDEAGQAVK